MKKPVALITHGGETMSFSEWATRLGVNVTTLHARVSRGRPLIPDPNTEKAYNMGVAESNRRRVKHGGLVSARYGRSDPVYKIYSGIKDRCLNPNATHYPRYGGRGITVCKQWEGDFGAFRDYMGPRPKGTTVERMDNNGGYEPGNVRWATRKEQANNRSTCAVITHEGLTMNIKQWAAHMGWRYGLIASRWKKGVRGAALFEPPKWERNKVYEFNGQYKTVAQWAKETGVPYPTLVWRLKHGKDLL